MEVDSDAQENELLALEAIYEKRQFVRSAGEPGGELNIYLAVASPFLIIFPPKATKNIDKDGNSKTPKQNIDRGEGLTEISVNHLPPIVLNFQLPADYPSSNPPDFTLSCKWLNELQITILCNHLDRIWNENGPGSVILFEWVQFLTDEVILLLNIESPFQLQPISRRAGRKNNKHEMAAKDHSDSRAVQDVALLTALAQVLVEYDSYEQTRLFEITYFDCDVCFLEKPGASCIAFYPCSHVYCCDCMAEYFKVQIKEGSVKSLTCPADKCVAQANPNQVRLLVDSETYEKYEKFLLQATLDCMSDVIYCPRKICQSPVIVEEESTMGMCPACSMAFCKNCKRSYHGVSKCPMSESECKQIQKRFLSANSEEKKAMEKQYGVKTLKYLLEDAFSEQWLESNAKRCPHCKAQIEKSDGCNKMSCAKCSGYFCWMCLAKLSKLQPYIHFNNPRSKCFNKLFHGVVIAEDEFEDYEEFF